MINETLDSCAVVISNTQKNFAIWAILLFKDWPIFVTVIWLHISYKMHLCIRK
jgi:hypothetical protein